MSDTVEKNGRDPLPTYLYVRYGTVWRGLTHLLSEHVSGGNREWCQHLASVVSPDSWNGLAEKDRLVGCHSNSISLLDAIRLRSLMIAVAMFLPCSGSQSLFGADPSLPALQVRFESDVRPFVKTYCVDCHNSKTQEGKLDLSGDSTMDAVIAKSGVWEFVLDRLIADEMPPQESTRRPTAEARQSAITWIQELRSFEARRHAGDPGLVLARRLSHAEFDYTIRDLIGFDLRPTREFPVDPANEAGFDNSGESLTMSPALVKKSLAAARQIADHLVLTPDGFEFASHPAVTETDRDKFCVQQIMSFYERHEIDLADYFMAAWCFENRESLGRSNALLIDFAKETRPSLARTNEADGTGLRIPAESSKVRAVSEPSLSPKYLSHLWKALTDPKAAGPLAELQVEWQKLVNDQALIDSQKPGALPRTVAEGSQDSSAAKTALRRECERLRDLVVKTRKSFDGKIEKLHVKGNSDGSQPLILWWNRQIAGQRMKYVGDGKDPALDAARDRFCRVFPNAFFLTSRGHYADANLGAQVRLLTAGFHLMQGYFRDDQPLCELVLDDSQRAEIDSLWRNLNFVTLVPFRQYKDFLFFERAEPPRFAGGPEFDFARPEDKDVTSEAKLNRMRDAYLEKAKKNGASEAAIEAIETYFSTMSADVRWIEQARIAAVPNHLEHLVRFAQRAYRRPLLAAERSELLAYYHQLRNDGALSHEDAMRDSIASILMSPHFCFRFDLASPGERVRSLNDYELASRLSYFLWSSMPDEKLLACAATGRLTQPEVLMEQTRRMLCDPRIRGLATEFAGNWLDFRRFEEHNSVDRERFPSFTNELRQAMYEEPLRFFIEIASHNRSILDFLDADYTFVNPVLAKHYGIDIDRVAASGQKADSDAGWVRVDNAKSYGRGGLPAMSVILTRNSPGLRTSPVKRGYWVVRRLLGERIPPPPPEVPELPKDEASLGELTLPQILARHRQHKACAGCHQRFDSIGVSFEGYGPIGERRILDLAGHPVQANAVFPDGAKGDGVEGLRQYLLERRRDEFIDNLSRKLLSYALGRSLILSDSLTIDQIRAKLAGDEYRFETLIESIVTSSQFLKKRGMQEPHGQ